MQERCGRCADVQHQLNKYDFEYELHFTPPKDTGIDALEYPIREPVLVDYELAPRGIVGHEEIAEWIDETIKEMRKKASTDAEREFVMELRSAYRNGNIRKEMTVVQNAKTDGLTVLDNLNDLGISHVDTIKIGKVIQ